MYGTLLLMCMKDLHWVQQHVHKSKWTNPLVAIAVPLERVARPLAVLCYELFGDQVQVLTHHSIRGLSVNVVHGLRHRRWIGAEDQFAGVQEDPERDYMVETRGKNKTVMWVESRPYGIPKKQPDPRRKGRAARAARAARSAKERKRAPTSRKRTPCVCSRPSRLSRSRGSIWA